MVEVCFMAGTSTARQCINYRISSPLLPLSAFITQLDFGCLLSVVLSENLSVLSFLFVSFSFQAFFFILPEIMTWKDLKNEIYKVATC